MYPDLQKICRLCLRENEGTVCIFPKEKSTSDKFLALSIPMRIMTCASLEVQDSDDFPKKICTDCRLQLEKSYYFRKMSQASDIKLRKHLRLVSMGKMSKVFTQKLHDDDDDDVEDELELKDSLKFIKEKEEKRKQKENRKFEKKINDMKLKHERELETTKEIIKTKCQEELIPLIREEIKKELRIEVQNELEESLRQEIMDQCLNEAKDLFLNDWREECRQSEIKSLLEDLQTYLTNKKQSLVESPMKVLNMSSTKTNKKQPLEYVEMELESLGEGKDYTSNPNVAEKELNMNDEECDSDENFLTYDTDEGFDIQKKISGNMQGYQVNNEANEIENDDDVMENNTEITENMEGYQVNNGANEVEYDDDAKHINAEITENTEESRRTTTTTSYIINELYAENLNQASYENRNMDRGDHIQEFEEAQEISKQKKQLLPKTVKPPDKNPKTIVSSTVPRTKATVEATFLTQSYVNTMERSTNTPKVFKCYDCPVVSSTKSPLERHLRIYTKVRKMGVTFQCPKCRIVFSSRPSLYRHMYTHCENKPLSYNLCDKSFVQKGILEQHKQTHTGVTPHQRPHCDRAFTQRINLTQHINRNHLKESRIRQHSCHLCLKRFNSASSLSRHLSIKHKPEMLPNSIWSHAVDFINILKTAASKTTRYKVRSVDI